MKCLISILFISFLGNNCYSMEQVLDNSILINFSAPNPINEISNNDLKKENIELKKQIEQLSKQVKQIKQLSKQVKQLQNMNNIDENNRKYLELKNLYKNFNTDFFPCIFLKKDNIKKYVNGGSFYKYNEEMPNSQNLCFCYYIYNDKKVFNDYHKKNREKCNGYCIFDAIQEYEQDFQKNINRNIEQIKINNQFLKLSLPNILDSNIKNEVQSMIDRYDSVLPKMNEYANLMQLDQEKLYSKIESIKEHNNFIKQELEDLHKLLNNRFSNLDRIQLIGSGIYSECKINRELWDGKKNDNRFRGLKNSGIFKTIIDDIKNERKK